MKQKIVLSRKNLDIVNKVILIDGFSGTGKSLLGSVLSHLPKAEQWQIDYFYEQLAVLNYIHKLPFESLKALCDVKSNEAIYNLFIGRNVNFRATDDASPLNNGLKKKYIDRIKKKEKIPALNEIIKSDPILILNIHYLFGYSKILLDVFWKNLNLYILMLRNPFYLIDYWYSRDLSSKRGKNKLDFGMLIEVNNKLLPWYTKEYSAAYIKANDFEKSVLTISELYKRVFKMFNYIKSQEKKKIQIIFFDDYLNHSSKYMNLICKKLNCKRDNNFNNNLNKIIRKSIKNKKNIIIDFKYFQKKYKNKISPHYEKMISELNILYNKFYIENKLI